MPTNGGATTHLTSSASTAPSSASRATKPARYVAKPGSAAARRRPARGCPTPLRAGCLPRVLLLARRHHGRLRPWCEPERPGPLVWSHIMRTGHGRCLVDRWPNPRTVLAEVAGNVSLRGDPGYLSDLDEPMTGFVEAPESFLAVLRELDPYLRIWDRVIFEFPGALPRLSQRPTPTLSSAFPRIPITPAASALLRGSTAVRPARTSFTCCGPRSLGREVESD